VRRSRHAPRPLRAIVASLPIAVLLLLPVRADSAAPPGQCFWVVLPPPIGGVLVCTP